MTNTAIAFPHSDEGYNFQNVGTIGSPIFCINRGGDYVVTANGGTTWNSGTLSLNKLASDGTTWLKAVSTAATADTVYVAGVMSAGQYQFVVNGATAQVSLNIGIGRGRTD
jgi:hypothetical protein